MSNDWPATRTGAVVVVVVMLAFTVVHVIVSRCTVRRIKAQNPSAIVSPFCRFFGLYVTGYSVVTSPETTLSAEYHTMCPGGCGNNHIDNIPRSRERVQIKPRPWTVSEFLFHVSVGFLFGLWVHFLPCFSWSCDWGEDDNEGVRGGIWFGLWGAYVLLAIVCGTFMKGQEIVVEKGNGTVETCRLGRAEKNSVEALLEKPESSMAQP